MKFLQLFDKKNKRRENESVKIVRNSEMFNERWYLTQYQDVFKKRKDAARHYYQKGWKENRNPSKMFSTVEYLKKYPECSVCPLLFEHNRNEYTDLSVCAVIKNEAQYVKEWLDYHLLVGVKRFYIYDNGSTDNLKEVVAPYVGKGIVVYKYCTDNLTQFSIYNECLNEYRDKTQWLSFINVDEFIVPVEKNTIQKFLKDYKDKSGVIINCLNYDSNGHIAKPNGGVLENYVRRQYEPLEFLNCRGKVIFQPSLCEKMDIKIEDYLSGQTKACDNGFVEDISIDKIRINHYYCKSKAEAIANSDTSDVFTKYGDFTRYIYDCAVFKYLEVLTPDKFFYNDCKKTICDAKNMFLRLKYALSSNVLNKSIDEKWYFNQYPDAKTSGLSAVEHYLTIGWKEGKNPNSDFDTNSYLEKNPDVKEAGVCPLLHHITYDKKANKLAGGILPKIQQEKNASNVTVIMPTYNRKNYLEKALNILKAQTLTDISFIIVDDGSTDGSADYIEEAIKNDKRFILIKNDTNQGPSAARNKALAILNSKYVGFFDVDDEIPADYFQKLYSKAVLNSADIVFTNYNDLEHDLKIISSEADKFSTLRNGAVWDKLYKVSLLHKNKIKFAEGLYTADNLFNIEAFYAAHNIVLTDEPRYSYKLHEDSIGNDENLIAKRKNDIITVCNKAIDFADENEFNLKTCISLYDFLRRSYDCYADDADFQDKLWKVLRKTGVKVNVSKVITKYDVDEYKMVEESEYFDSRYYRLRNPQLWLSFVNPAEHYLKIGWVCGKNPSKNFDGNKYLKANADVAASGTNPLLHYLKYGMADGRTCETVENLGTKISHILTYPIRVKEEYDRLVAEIKALENMK